MQLKKIVKISIMSAAERTSFPGHLSTEGAKKDEKCNDYLTQS